MTNEDIVNEARSWVGTRFLHQGRLKKTEALRGGCDCIGLVIGVANALGIESVGKSFSAIDQRNYARNNNGLRLKAALDNYLLPLWHTEDGTLCHSYLQPGNIVLMRIAKEPQHVGFLGDYAQGGLSLIHCYIAAGGVVEHAFDEFWQKRVVGVYGLL